MRSSKWEGFGMLRWQPQKLHERTRFLTKLLGASVALHIVVCLCLFFYQANGGKISFDTKKMMGRNVIVKVLSFGQKKPAPRLRLSATSGSQVVSNKSKTLKTSVVKAQLTKPVAKKTSVVSSKKLSDKKKVTEKKKTKPGKTKKNIPAVAKSHDGHSKATADKGKKNIQQAAALKPESIKQEVAPAVEQQVVEKKESIPEVPVQPIVQQQEIVEQPVAVQAEVASVVDGQTAETVDDQVLYVSQEEFADIELQRMLADALAQAWHQPVGIPETAECQALIEVDRQGTLLSYKLIKTSGIMIYDVSVEQGIKTLTFPRPVWGKTIELIFKPWTSS